MSNQLQQRAQSFLERPIPDGLPYAPDSMSERFVRAYATDGVVELDAELTELLGICVMEAEFASKSKSPEEAEFFGESCEILSEILAECSRST